MAAAAALKAAIAMAMAAKAAFLKGGLIGLGKAITSKVTVKGIIACAKAAKKGYKIYKRIKKAHDRLMPDCEEGENQCKADDGYCYCTTQCEGPEDCGE